MGNIRWPISVRHHTRVLAAEGYVSPKGCEMYVLTGDAKLFKESVLEGFQSYHDRDDVRKV